VRRTDTVTSLDRHQPLWIGIAFIFLPLASCCLVPYLLISRYVMLSPYVISLACRENPFVRQMRRTVYSVLWLIKEQLYLDRRCQEIRPFWIGIAFGRTTYIFPEAARPAIISLLRASQRNRIIKSFSIWLKRATSLLTPL
jgi:hypothetical protein